MELIIGVAIAYLIINAIVASFMRQAALEKGYDDGAHAWAMSFWLGIAGWIYVVALPDLIARRNQEKIIAYLAKGDLNAENKEEEDRLPEL